MMSLISSIHWKQTKTKIKTTIMVKTRMINRAIPLFSKSMAFRWLQWLTGWLNRQLKIINIYLSLLRIELLLLTLQYKIGIKVCLGRLKTIRKKRIRLRKMKKWMLTHKTHSNKRRWQIRNRRKWKKHAIGSSLITISWPWWCILK